MVHLLGIVSSSSFQFLGNFCRTTTNCEGQCSEDGGQVRTSLHLNQEPALPSCLVGLPL